MSWDEFRELFNQKYYSNALRVAKVNEFTSLVQGSMSVTEYALKFDRLAKFAPNLVPTNASKQDRFFQRLNAMIAWYVRITSLTRKVVQNIHLFSGSLLGVSRGGLGISEIVDSMEERGINMLFVLGGNGTHAGANVIHKEEARALLGRLEYQKGNIEAALHVFEGIDIAAVTPRMKGSISRRCEQNRHRSQSDSVPPMSMHAVSLLLEAVLLKEKSLQGLGRYEGISFT
ncbi:uncharacterized protein LOC133828722 [Humulus lupulus]|uniref:uncharacterized protein LOC133828722 n=1 Tax=Humulus lupulus TaxID=3486 RepID=UPI002B4093FE|nr:uncharacterized protein LOC133828722 [Humulus lupulus]